MSPPDLEPLDADLDALLDAERRRPSAPPEVHARVLSRVAATLGPGGGGSPPPPPAPPAAALGPLAKSILMGAALGGVVSIGIVTRPDPAPAPAARIAIVAPTVRAPSSEAPSAAPAAAPAPANLDRTGTAGGPPSSPPARASAADPGRPAGFAAERRLLDEAQRALAEGRTDAAMEALDRHERTFPHGSLGEERESLAIRALARAGHTAEARARADRLRAAYPNSIQLPAIDPEAGTIP